MSTLILHNYPMSPFSEKTRAMLGVAGLSWRSAPTREMPPRPVLAALAGGYRKVPLAQIGADLARIGRQRGRRPLRGRAGRRRLLRHHRADAGGVTRLVLVQRSYEANLSMIEAAKSAQVDYYIIDVNSRQTFKNSFTKSEAKSFDVAYDVHADDPDRS